ncbi:sugar transferase [Polynucleobacter sp. MG-6-Vaara-E2]|uniref:sugar transferase n=1 Tax=Polynucleobacter sp. MG-6-Vaara-E2 TaxID=2576932 RepID=UPI001BFD80CF|nr:sugar transferase [Polynucleobacter sp. MG-6-Vaara-E2]QWD96931.1 sugar transferase [Polynucleobacter sp. MG-6-Vaara-E2]
MKRIFDLMLAILASALLAVVIMGASIAIKLTSRGPILYWSDRVGRLNRVFQMPKFRTMKVDTPVVATHLLRNPDVHMTSIGTFLRKYSIDELPQLWSIFVGHMSFVGPRPALFNQYDLIALRTKFGVEKMLPGLTGWAQINGRDDLSVELKVKFDVQYMERQNFRFDLQILILTFFKVIEHSGVKH